jgi:aspartate racemase
MSELADRGAEGILLGCTEIELLLDAGDARVPLFDTHATARAKGGRTGARMTSSP